MKTDRVIRASGAADGDEGHGLRCQRGRVSWPRRGPTCVGVQINGRGRRVRSHGATVLEVIDVVEDFTGWSEVGVDGMAVNLSS